MVEGLLWANKHPLYMDVANGVVGTYMGKDETDEPGYVKVRYVPLQGVRVRKTQYKIPQEAIIGPVPPPDTDMPGVPREVVVTYEVKGGGKPFWEQVMNEVENRIDRLQKKKTDEEWERKKQEARQKQLKDKEEKERTPPSRRPERYREGTRTRRRGERR